MSEIIKLVDLSFPHRVHLHHFLAGSHNRLGRKQFDLNFHLGCKCRKNMLRYNRIFAISVLLRHGKLTVQKSLTI
ncbi:hypothetical protein BpHYR1_025209 [Brachionus plicatilis]|uniref:Uncharacterized protein n=1 Tax=Brachionus plicatilis TaxID=10195 RepID=A0A3M7PZJ7_BRAPC|nr:hypothetical protein BpHYR1_025209 [Brachionus plicatilis]